MREAAGYYDDEESEEDDDAKETRQLAAKYVRKIIYLYIFLTEMFLLHFFLELKKKLNFIVDVDKIAVLHEG